MKTSSRLTKKALIITLSYFALLSLTCCTPKKELVNNSELIKVSQPRVFASTFKNGLYKVNMVIHKRELTGLLFFNQRANSMRTIMLSEVGLKYFDIEFDQNKERAITIHQVTEFLDNRYFLDAYRDFLELIMIDPDREATTYRDPEGPILFIRVERINGEKTTYTYNSNSGAVNRIERKKTTILLSDYDYLSPGLITCNNGKARFEFEKVKKE